MILNFGLCRRGGDFNPTALRRRRRRCLRREQPLTNRADAGTVIEVRGDARSRRILESGKLSIIALERVTRLNSSE